MLPSYETITSSFADTYHPGFKGGGIASLLDTTLGYVWNGLMSKDYDGHGPLRVVSAWMAIAHDDRTEDGGYDEWGDILKRAVEKDLGMTIAATDCYDIDPVYQSYAWLYQAFGESWPIKALAARLRKVEGKSRADARALAETVWEHALKVYSAHKAATATMDAA
ncbi:hypothetical protein ACUTAF_19650 [Pseudomonas sp. SP16.1]|uniref:hypothetical protein n=1 Tax=Pseudomonas sp. SP16.1 TaxID=3458854 RepID=UPI004045BC86